jgi:hypothetical protein
MPKLVPDGEFSEREPQEFGMISFTDWSPPAPPKHREQFGDFGIVVSREWAQAKKKVRGFASENIEEDLRAQRVIYIEEGPVLDALRWLYTTAHNHLNSQSKDDALTRIAPTSVILSKVMARIEGEDLWSNLLTIYEYLALGENAYQSEWRIVNHLPVYGYAPSISELIKAVSPPEGWAKVTGLRTLRAPDAAINGFVCPRQAEASLREAMPPQFSTKQIVLV